MISVKGRPGDSIFVSTGFVLHDQDRDTQQLFLRMGSIPGHESRIMSPKELNAKIIRILRQEFETQMRDLEYLIAHQKPADYIIDIDQDRSGPLVNSASLE